MKHYFTFFVVVFSICAYGQSYQELSRQAISAYDKQEYASAVLLFKAAFKIDNTNKGDAYDAACSAALMGDIDLAFEWLTLSKNNGWTNVRHMKSDSDLNILRDDARWKPIVEAVQIELDKIEISYNKPLQKELLDIYSEDQDIRHLYIEASKKYGFESAPVDSLGRLMEAKDEKNLKKIIAILDKYGWVGPDVVGGQANQTLFLVIQHSNLSTQQKYLPMMREAVKNKKATGSSLALLEDRVALGEGRRQTYGSQIGTDNTSGKNYILPLDDPDNVDKRRAEVGLGPLADYVSKWNIVWDAEAYKKELPALEAIGK
jgi:hypothetical protein